jgi:hypothetical protein
MNTELFTDWFITNLLNYLEEGSITEMDNASYHYAILNKAPSKKTQNLKFLTGSKNKNVTLDPAETGAELLQRV